MSDADDAVDGKVFYLKMKGDYYRYMSEVASEEEKAGRYRVSDLKLKWVDLTFDPRTLCFY